MVAVVPAVREEDAEASIWAGVGVGEAMVMFWGCVSCAFFVRKAVV